MIRKRRPSRQMLALMDALSASRTRWRHGYELMKETGLSSGTLYPLLMRMAGQGLVEAEWRMPERPGGHPRHVYRLTAAGFALAQEASASRSARQPKAAYA